jgi:hypothetical protein
MVGGVCDITSRKQHGKRRFVKPLARHGEIVKFGFFKKLADASNGGLGKA